MEHSSKWRRTAVLAIIIVGFGGYAIGYANGHAHTTSSQLNTAGHIATNAKTLTPLLGNPKAKLTITEYADYQCPYCAQFNEQILPKIKTNFIDTGKVNFRFMNAPLLGNESIAADAAAYCANDQHKYWQYHDELYKITSEKNGNEQHPVLNQGIFSTANLETYAADTGLNTSQFNQCLTSSKYETQAANDAITATQAGIQGTPYFRIGAQAFNGIQPYDIMKTLIESQL